VALTVSIQNLGVGPLDVHDLAVIAGYIGAALGVSMVVPQIIRTFRNRALPGVSALSWALTALSCMTWLLYGFRADEIPQIPGNALIVSGAVVIVLAVPSVTSMSARAVRLAIPALVITGLAVVLPPTLIGFLAFGIGLVSAVPQLVESLLRSNRNASAVSMLAWVLRAASQVCWLLYALARHDITVTISATFILSSSVLLVMSEQRRRPEPEAAADAALLDVAAATR
jgi:uncharacterized protein with PQ loop repeat